MRVANVPKTRLVVPAEEAARLRDFTRTAYFDVELWPQGSIAKFGGAVKAKRQGRGFGGACGLAAVEWCFDQLGVLRICETTAVDNDRSIRLLSRLGFRQMGEVISVRRDGPTARHGRLFTGNAPRRLDSRAQYAARWLTRSPRFYENLRETVVEILNRLVQREEGHGIGSR